MQAIREIVSREMLKNFNIPEEFGDEFEMILIPTKDLQIGTNIESEDQKLMRYQSENGFSKNILAQECEDVWNDI